MILSRLASLTKTNLRTLRTKRGLSKDSYLCRAGHKTLSQFWKHVAKFELLDEEEFPYLGREDDSEEWVKRYYNWDSNQYVMKYMRQQRKLKKKHDYKDENQGETPTWYSTPKIEMNDQIVAIVHPNYPCLRNIGAPTEELGLFEMNKKRDMKVAQNIEYN